jgi:LysM repeat protein
VNGLTRAGAGRAAGARQLLGGVVVTIISVGMLLGGFLLSGLDSSSVRLPPTRVGAVLVPSPTPYLPTVTSTFSSTPSPAVSASPPPSATSTAVPPVSTPSMTPVALPPLIPSCPQPPGWFVYTVRPGDTLAGLAWRYGITALALKEANCLSTLVIHPGQQVFLPPAVYASPTPWSCGPPLGWVVYIVRSGDTLFSLSMRFGVGIEAIRRANCLPDYVIRSGQALYLPPLPPTPIPPATSSPIPTLPPTSTPTGTPVSSPTLTPIPTQVPTFTPSPVPTGYPTLTATPTSTGTPAQTPTYTSTPTETPGPTSTSTFTPTPTPTPAPTSTYTPTPTPTELPTSTHTPTPTFTPSATSAE